ncbi:MAG TPA: thiamine pyrophosphate-dependent dehydrogenase E1 component subunit alpha [Spirochaetes bacterium]|nr:thiamine pyrophosphate-dependent dehydrogenase E1 component subunit alpha [Spirochaetota bacterium]
MDFKKSDLIEMYRSMYLIRHFEIKTKELFAAAKIPGFVHLYAGEEGVAVGVCSALRKDDYIGSTHRGHGHCIAKGGDVKYMMAELYGKETGYCKGKGGSMHIADFDLGILGACGIVGGSLPLITGAALNFKYKETNQVAVAFFGDGATNQGSFHESVNLAAIWDLPILFVCENNQYAESTHISSVMKVEKVADRAAAYGIPGITVDGNDVLAVHDAALEAIENARQGKGPTFLECVTCRHYGHFEGDADTYRTKEMVEDCKKRCPIKKLGAFLVEEGFVSEKELEEVDKNVEEEVAGAIDFAESSPWPKPEEAFTDIFVTPYY